MIVIKLVPVLLAFTTAYSKNCASTYDLAEGCDQDYGTVLDVFYDVKSVKQCAIQCSGNLKCASVKYDSVTKDCRTNSGIYKKMSTGCSDEITYASLTTISCRKVVYDDCDSSDECMVTNSNCRGHKCLCSPGYSYNPANGSCVAECEEYGFNFTPDAGNYISGYNDRVLYYSDIETCRMKCVEEVEFLCRTIEFSFADDTCFLSEKTVLTVDPGDYMSLPSYTLFQRNCQTPT